MQKILENSGVALFILIVTIIGTSFTVILKLDTTSNAVDDVKADVKADIKVMSNDIKDLQINMAVLNAKNNMKSKRIV